MGERKGRTDLLQAARLLLHVLPHKLLQWVPQLREGGDGPVKGGHVQLVDGLGVCGRQAAWGQEKHLTTHCHF